MFTMSVWTSLALSLVLPCDPGVSLQAHPPSVLVLTDGTKLAGIVQRDGASYRVRVGKRTHRVSAKSVERWISPKVLSDRFERLRNLPESDAPHAVAQRALWAFDNGLDDEAWPLLAVLLDSGQRTPSLARVEAAAAERLLARLPQRTRPVDLGRELLLSARGKGDRGVDGAKHHAASQALGILLRIERKSSAQKKRSAKKSANALATLCRKFAADALHPQRKSIARNALLAAKKDDRQFVWRQAILWPKGPTRSHVVSEIQQHGQSDAAATYLTRWLNHGNATLKLRSAEALGELGSKAALPALRAMRTAIRKKVARRRRGGGSGSSRANVSFTTQQAYIADVDVEVAQGAAIADPQVRTLTSGVVLDATVGGISWERYIIVLDSTIRRSIAALQ